MGYCLSCDKEQKTGKFCLICGRQLSSGKDQIDAANPIALKSGKSNLAMWAHLAPLIGALVGYWTVLPLVLLWLPGLLIRNSAKATDFERRHATESMNFQFTLLVVLAGYSLIGGIVTLATLGLALVVLLPVLVGVGIFALVVNIMAVSAGSAGREYKYPLTIRFVK
ncbi:MAG: DUF4870 domain-containing protein [Actinomycetes bacterium]